MVRKDSARKVNVAEFFQRHTAFEIYPAHEISCRNLLFYDHGKERKDKYMLFMLPSDAWKWTCGFAWERKGPLESSLDSDWAIPMVMIHTSPHSLVYMWRAVFLYQALEFSRVLHLMSGKSHWVIMFWSLERPYCCPNKVVPVKNITSLITGL